ncbi:hypothetical protein ACGFI3_40985 [Nonomuraea wenchangensis]|uniref:hypothetical protein n=1 Tax=Nonomuraea wenchangensis TaxID=568860 RepID=UPI003714489E
MTRGLLLASLAAGTLVAPASASTAAAGVPVRLLPVSAPVPSSEEGPVIRAISVRPADPVVGPRGSVRLVIDVVAKGTSGKNGVTVKVEPGAPPGPVLASKPLPDEPPSDPTPAEQPDPEFPADPFGPGSSSDPSGPGSSAEHSRPGAPAEHSRRGAPAEHSRPVTSAEHSRRGAPAERYRPGSSPERSRPRVPAETADPEYPVEYSQLGLPDVTPELGFSAGPSGVTAAGELPGLTDPVAQATPTVAATPAEEAAPTVAATPAAPADSATPADPATQAEPTAPDAPATPTDSTAPTATAPTAPAAPAGSTDSTDSTDSTGSTDSTPTESAVPAASSDLALASTAKHAGATSKARGPYLHLVPLTSAVVANPGARREADGWETWRFLPDKRLSRYYPTGTWTVAATARGKDGRTVTEYATFQFRRATRLSPVHVEKAGSGGAVRVRGSLTRVDPRGLTDYGPYGKQRLEVLWRQDWHSEWRQVAQTVTDAAGGFDTRIWGRPQGYWRVRFPGNTHYAAYTSRTRRTQR